MTVAELPGAAGGTHPAAPAPPAPARRRRPWWLYLLAFLCITFSVMSFVRIVLQDQSLAMRIPYEQYQWLALHVAFGSVALMLAWMQVWPWLRTTHPRLHRRIGWTYFLLGAIPSALLAIPVSLIAGVGHAYRTSLFTLGVLWLATTWFGLRSAVRGDHATHRRWMLRNIACATAIVSARPLTVLHWFGLAGIDPAHYPFEGDLTYVEAMTAAMWGAVVLHLVIVEWWLLRPRRQGSATTGGAR